MKMKGKTKKQKQLAKSNPPSHLGKGSVTDTVKALDKSVHIPEAVREGVKEQLKLIFKKKVIMSNLSYLRDLDPRPMWKRWPIILDHVEELIKITTELEDNPAAIEELYNMRSDILKLIARPDQYPLDPTSPCFVPSQLNPDACEFVPTPTYIENDTDLRVWYHHYCTLLFQMTQPYDIYRSEYYFPPSPWM